MNSQSYEVKKPNVSYTMNWPEGLLLLFCVLTPIGAWCIWRSSEILQASGNIVVFFAAVAEFISLHRMNKKHILNACRVKAGETPWDFSSVSKVVGIAAFICALAGIILSGFGKLIFGT